MKTRTKLLVAMVALLVVMPLSFPFENTFSTRVVARAYLYAFGTNSGRTGGYIFFDTAHVEATAVGTVLQAVEVAHSHPVSSWEVVPQYQNYPATFAPAHTTTYYMTASLVSGSFNETIGFRSPEVTQTGPFIATISIPMGDLTPGRYAMTLELFVNGTTYQDRWAASVYIG